MAPTERILFVCLGNICRSPAAEGVVRAMTCSPANVGRSTPEMLRTLDALQAVDAGSVLAPANWEPGDDLLQQPSALLDDVFAAPGQTDWFLTQASPGKRK